MSHPMARVMPLLVIAAVAAVGLLVPDDGRSVQAAPGPNEVLVVNPAANPARTTVVGPVTATIANTTAIPVAVEGTPTVAVSGPVTVGVSGPVTVGNTDEEAIPVRDTGAPIPWVVGGQIIIDPGEKFESEQFLAVPLGFRLVIEAVSISGSLPTGQVVSEATLLATAPGASGTFRFLPLPWPKTHAAFDRFGTHEVTRVNVRGGAGVIVAVARGEDVTATGIFNVALSGYMVKELTE